MFVSVKVVVEYATNNATLLHNIINIYVVVRFWSGRREAWPRMVPETSTVSNVFGSRVYERYRLDLTLVEATARNDGEENPFGGLVKEGTAALLNSYARKSFPYKPWQVKTLVIQALVSEAAAASQAKRFSLANQACL